jgi:hypothetical protein
MPTGSDGCTTCGELECDGSECIESKRCKTHACPIDCAVSEWTPAIYTPVNLKDKSRGMMLGLLVGDSLGAAVEGTSPGDVVKVALAAACNGEPDPFITSYVPAIQMGTVVKEIQERAPTKARMHNDTESSSPGIAQVLKTGQLTHVDIIAEIQQYQGKHWGKLSPKKLIKIFKPYFRGDTERKELFKKTTSELCDVIDHPLEGKQLQVEYKQCVYDY